MAAGGGSTLPVGAALSGGGVSAAAADWVVLAGRGSDAGVGSTEAGGLVGAAASHFSAGSSEVVVSESELPLSLLQRLVFTKP